MSEFEGDIKRTKYLKRLFRRYKITKTIKERLILNHIILLNNVFGSEATARILFYKTDERDYDILKTFLSYLNLAQNVVYGINGKNVLLSEIPVRLKCSKNIGTNMKSFKQFLDEKGRCLRSPSCSW
jgi:hypothetical protein